MFRTSVLISPNNNFDQAVADALFAAHPAEIAGFMEQTWATTGPVTAPVRRPMPVGLFHSPTAPLTNNPIVLVPHLIESFCLENTRMVEIFQRIISLYASGEQLAVPPDQAASNSAADIGPWLRTTELIMFSEASPYSAFNVTSNLRHNPHLIRQNAYIRMFGSNVLNPIQSDANVMALPPMAANREFWPTLERLLAEVWRGIIHGRNTSGRNDTDPAAIARYCLLLNDMLSVRRLGGNIYREEFVAGCLTTWFHVALMWDSPIVRALKSEAENPADRLIKLGERIGVPAHSRSASYIQLANQLGYILTNIEAGLYNTAATAQNLYMPGTVADIMSEIITLYMNATGRDLKASTVSLAQRA
jgi:hypothetical protein